MKKITENIGAILIVVAIGVGVSAWLAGMSVRMVMSGSMEPAIHTGAVVVTMPREVYDAGDVVTFQTDAAAKLPTTHRIVDMRVEQGIPVFVTRGDANDNDDFTPVALENIMGQVLFSVPYLGFVFDFAKQPLGFMLLVGIPALLIMIQEIQKIVAEVRRKKVAITENSNTETI